MRWKSILFILLCMVGTWGYVNNKSEHRKLAQSLTKEEPQQTSVDSWVQPFTLGEYQLKPLAKFDVTALALSTQRYSLDREAELSPVDFALGWGMMSDPDALDKISISQSNRWYYWHYSDPSVQGNEISTHSGNMHMIPANDEIREVLLAVQEGDVVEIHGQLIQAKGTDGYIWTSSLSRNDSGEHACEVVWVESAGIR